MKARILLWCEEHRLRGEREPQHTGKAMGPDGGMITQANFTSRDLARSCLTTEERFLSRYSEQYPLGYELVWLDHPEENLEWWADTFAPEQMYRIIRSGAVTTLVGHRLGQLLATIEQRPGLPNDIFEVTVGSQTALMQTFPDAMREAHRLVKECE